MIKLYFLKMDGFANFSSHGKTFKGKTIFFGRRLLEIVFSDNGFDSRRSFLGEFLQAFNLITGAQTISIF